MKTFRNHAYFIVLCLLVGCAEMDGTEETYIPPAAATPRPAGELKTFHIRPDGGDTAQCTGQADQPYTGEGAGLDCAWDHPFRALPPGGPSRIQGGDTLIIHSGDYAMGTGAINELNPDLCSSDYPWDCVMPPIPAGPDADHPTRVLGEGWDQGCAQPPELWGLERASHILDLSGSQHVLLACLDITDHAACAEDHPDPAYRCERNDFPYGDWAVSGLYAQDASHITLQDITIHGMGVHGIMAGRLSDWQIENLALVGNGWVGWEGDIEGDDSNSGTLSFSHWTVAWNGCVESYPPGEMMGCWAQPAGGYGDGVGTGETGGHWLIKDSAFMYNTSDGLDLLYGNEDINIEIYRSWFEGNAGNQLKTSGPLILENSVLIGNCNFFEGKDFSTSGVVDHCRATGVALSVVINDQQQARIINNTFTGEGDCLIVPECEAGHNCAQPGTIFLRNNLFQGQTDAIQPDELVCLVYEETFQSDPFDMDYSLIAGVKDNACPGPNDLCLDDLGLVSNDLDDFDPQLTGDSPAVDTGLLDVCPSEDYWGNPRPQGEGCDIGAHEWIP